jgi:MYXO-CTERM domain-containing protein
MGGVEIDFWRHGLAPGTIVDRIKLVADCNIGPDSSNYWVVMAAVVDPSCELDDECDDKSDCTVDGCIAGACEYLPLPAGTPCEGGYCDGLQIPHCFACAEDSNCPAATPVCLPDAGICVECVLESDCEAPTPYCEWDTNTCVTCLSDLHCDDANECTTDSCLEAGSCLNQPRSTGTPCSTGMRDFNPGPVWVECLEDDDCPFERPYCGSDGGCMECRYDSHCNDSIGCTEDVCASGVCISYDGGQCPTEVGGGGAGGSGSPSSSGAGGVGGADVPPPGDGCDCVTGSPGSKSHSSAILAALALGFCARRARRRPRRPWNQR